MTTVSIDSLRESDSPRILGENNQHIRTLAESEVALPPILVHRPTMRVIDGMHRLRAAMFQGTDKIKVQFYEGDEADAFVVGVRVNSAHGLPLSLPERKAAAARIATSHPHWSDRMVAEVTGLSHKTVGKIRRRPGGDIPQLDMRVGSDGRVHPRSAKDGRRRAGELMGHNLDTPLRQVAKAAGISVETARDVRNRLKRDEDPVPPQRSAGQRRHLPTCGSSASNPSTSWSDGVSFTPSQELPLIVQRLRKDPSLRFSETGRVLLRLFSLHAADAAQWERVIENVPRRWASLVADAASQCARVWGNVAEQIHQYHFTSPPPSGGHLDNGRRAR